MDKPLQERIRPTSLDEIVGQSHLVGENGILRKIIKSNHIPNMIFYGPSGTGKTTIANIIASLTNKALYKVNATNVDTQDIKDIISKIGTLDAQNGILLYLDEIQYFSKRQQQILLEYIEKGDITLISSTTENPYFYIYNALLSRSIVFEFEKITKEDLISLIERTINYLKKENNTNIDIEEGLTNYIASSSGGDARKVINSIELLFNVSAHYNNTYFFRISDYELLNNSRSSSYDKFGDEHYDLLSAFQKSIRGSDPDASIFYLGKLLEAGDLLSPIRRLLVISSEDIGLGYPNAISITKACCDSALQLGLPEARIPLAQATILLATSPKSNSAINAIDEALQDIKLGKGTIIPNYLKDAHYSGSKKLGRGIDYLYPHDYQNHYVKQDYLPKDLLNKKYYEYQDNKYENQLKKYWEEIKKDNK